MLQNKSMCLFKCSNKGKKQHLISPKNSTSHPTYQEFVDPNFNTTKAGPLSGQKQGIVYCTLIGRKK